jgi:hypothetical protein
LEYVKKEFGESRKDKGRFGACKGDVFGAGDSVHVRERYLERFGACKGEIFGEIWSI